MTNIIRRLLSVATLLSLVPVAAGVSAQPMNVKAIEIAQLPLFCWSQFGVPNTDGPQYHFPPYTECGWGMNHYCAGLLQIVRAKRTTNKLERAGLIKVADTNVRYTERAISGYPKCSLRPHVEGARAEVNHLAAIFRVPIQAPQVSVQSPQ